ncbi:Protein of unknown function [Pseudorhodobacter antarcticus]|uniref:DUF3131 domain-containing protein n=2 Tax=Pseudorhodobacter antarcticus TaxID=1077947 RepID=A0A1H8N1M8_9RHOB|nr:Protein of unknown function [Pseudorhodobacter antarcticus]
MRRRTFLTAVAFGSIIGRSVSAQEIVPPQPQRVLFTITGINARTNAESLGTLLSALVANAVPVNLVVDSGDSPTPLWQGSEIGRLLARYFESFPGLIDVVAWCPDLGQEAPYQAARAAQKVRQSLVDILYGPSGPGLSRQPLLSIACKSPLDSPAASATLSAGFRTVIALPDNGLPVEARLDLQGVLSLLGGEVLRVEEAATALSRNLPGLQRHFIFAAGDVTRTATDVLFAAARDIGRILKAAALDLSMVSDLASAVQMRTDGGFRRRVVLHLLEPTPADPLAMAHLAALQDMLRAEKILFSTGPDITGSIAAGTGDLSYWVPLAIVKSDRPDQGLMLGTFAKEPLSLALPGSVAADDMRFGVVVKPVVGGRRITGLAAQAELNIPVLAYFGAVGEEPFPDQRDLETLEDGVLLVAASALSEPALRTAFLHAIRPIVARTETRMMSLATYCAETLPQDLLLPTLLLTRAKRLKPVPPATGILSAERAELLEDAQSAWAYFSDNTIRSTGLCPATMTLGTRPSADFLAASMWEIGSHVNALIAAVDLGLIPDEDFADRIKRLLRTVERASRKRLVLPPETINAQSGKGTTRFNSFDTGRLMISLGRLNRHRLAPAGLDALVASWDFAQVIIDRRLHSYRGKQMIEDFASNYTDYVAAGMRLWGFDVASPFDDFARVATADDEARLLAATVAFGPLGAEPSLLYLIEMEPSPSASFLADCLDALQSRLAKESGVPAAASETPLDRFPWFTYQGYDLSKFTDPWIVQFAGEDGTTVTDISGTSLRAISSKAAYLWHAVRPNAYSTRLIDSLRHQARTKSGFKSALYFTAQTATTNYADLNTNAVILQSIAHILTKG